MQWLKELREKGNEAIQGLQTQASKYKNGPFADATMAICALMAYADGEVTADERQKTVQFIVKSEPLQAFDKTTLSQKFKNYCAELEEEPEFGKLSLIQAVGKLRNKPDQAAVAMQVGVLIANADGVFDDKEKVVAREICGALGLQPDAYVPQ